MNKIFLTNNLSSPAPPLWLKLITLAVNKVTPSCQVSDNAIRTCWKKGDDILCGFLLVPGLGAIARCRSSSRNLSWSVRALLSSDFYTKQVGIRIESWRNQTSNIWSVCVEMRIWMFLSLTQCNCFRFVYVSAAVRTAPTDTKTLWRLECLFLKLSLLFNWAVASFFRKVSLNNFL